MRRGVHVKVVHVRVHKRRVHLKVLVDEVRLITRIILLMHGLLWVLRIDRVGFAWVGIVLMTVGRWRVVVWLVIWFMLKLHLPPEQARALLCILMTHLPCRCLIEMLHLFLFNVLIIDFVHYVSSSRLVDRGEPLLALR